MWNEIVDRYPGLSGNVFSSYLSLFARLPEITLADIVLSFEESRELMRVPAMKNAVCVSTPETYALVYSAFKPNLESSFAAYLRGMGVDHSLYEMASQEIQGVLADDDLTALEIGKRLRRFKDMKQEMLSGILNSLCADRVLVRARAVGGLKGNRLTYSLWNSWTKPVARLRTQDFKTAVLELAAVYFDAYPDATVEDFRWWGGWNAQQLGLFEQEIDYSRIVADVKPLEDAWPGWYLLPPLDALTMAYRDPLRWLDPEWTDWVFDSAGNSTSVIFRDGRAAGLWDLIELEDVLYEVRVALFDPREHATFEIEQAIRALGRFLDIEIERVVHVRPQRPLKDMGATAFRSPLKNAEPA